jgi:hypothetical protein
MLAMEIYDLIDIVPAVLLNFCSFLASVYATVVSLGHIIKFLMLLCLEMNIKLASSLPLPLVSSLPSSKSALDDLTDHSFSPGRQQSNNLQIFLQELLKVVMCQIDSAEKNIKPAK